MTKREVEEYIMSQIFPNASHEVTAQNVRNAFGTIVDEVWDNLRSKIGDLSHIAIEQDDVIKSIKENIKDLTAITNAHEREFETAWEDIEILEGKVDTIGSKVGELEDVLLDTFSTKRNWSAYITNLGFAFQIGKTYKIDIELDGDYLKADGTKAYCQSIYLCKGSSISGGQKISTNLGVERHFKSVIESQITTTESSSSLYISFNTGYSKSDNDYVNIKITDTSSNTITRLAGNIGDLSQLQTEDKSDLVGSINEALTKGGVTIDDSLTKQGEAADAKKVGDTLKDITQVVEDVKNSTELIVDNFEEETVSEEIQGDVESSVGYISATGGLNTTASYIHTDKIAVKEGDILTIQGVSVQARFIAFYDTNENIVSSKGSNTAKNFPLSITSDGFIVVSFSGSVKTYTYVIIRQVKKIVPKLKASVDNIAEKVDGKRLHFSRKYVVPKSFGRVAEINVDIKKGTIFNLWCKKNYTPGDTNLRVYGNTGGTNYLLQNMYFREKIIAPVDLTKILIVDSASTENPEMEVTLDVVYQEGVREVVHIYNNDSQKEIYDKLVYAYVHRNCDVKFQCGEYIFDEIYDIMRSDYGVTKFYELPIGGDCHYDLGGATLIQRYSGDKKIFGGMLNLLGDNHTGGGFVIENGTLINEGGTYCFHDDVGAHKRQYYNVFRNLNMIIVFGEDSDMLSKCIGGGLGQKPNIEINNCYFEKRGTVPEGLKFQGHVTYHGPGSGTCDCNIRVSNSYIPTFRIYPAESSSTGLLLFNNNKYKVFESTIPYQMWGNETIE